MCCMRVFFINFLIFSFLINISALAEEPVFYETVPMWGKMIMLSVAFAIPTKIILAHIGLFEFLDSDSFPKPPPLTKTQSELLAAGIVGLVFGSFMTVIFIIVS